ncbi:MAG: hemerythrin family protein [Bryobacteraceae bacterium]|jgi:hemerythrin-like metal-binding protein
MRTYNRKNVSPVYFAAFDAEHMEVFDAMEALRLAVAAGAPAERVQAAARQLAEHVGAHFAHEERLMRASRYSGYAWHMQSHDAARKRMRLVAERVQAGDAAGVSALVGFCKSWLRDHTGLHDRMMTAYLRDYQREGGQLPS